MKKILPFLVIAFLLVGAAPVHAAGLGEACSNNDGCDGDLICTASKCAVDPEVDTTAPPAASTAATPATPTSAAATGGDLNASAQTFVPLTGGNLGTELQGIANSNNISAFFQNLYKICIGLAAVLAVLQLVRAGVMYMGGDSVTETKEARRLIGTALFGLLLVLSPVIVFSIINPNILSLNIGISSLQSNATTGVTTTTSQNVSGSTLQSQSAAQCQQFKNISLFSAGGTCSDFGANYTSAPDTCCGPHDTGYMCCGQSSS